MTKGILTATRPAEIGAALIPCVSDRRAAAPPPAVHSEAATPPAPQADRIDAPESVLAYARSVLAARRHREKLLTGLDFGEPAWDILLDLFVSSEEGRRVSVSGVCLGATVPATTVLRQINAMVESGYLLRVPDERDGRRVFVTLSDSARSRVADCLRRLMMEARSALRL